MQAATGGAQAPLVKLGSLWIGGNLSWLEQLCIRSFLDHGHEVTLYTYEGVTNAPAGTRIADANALFPATAFITHRASGSPAYHADAFRYRMIAETGLAWIDVRPEPMAAYNAEIQRELEAIAPWRAGCSDYYRAPGGRIVTQWPRSMTAMEQALAGLDVEAYESVPVGVAAGTSA